MGANEEKAKKRRVTKKERNAERRFFFLYSQCPPTFFTLLWGLIVGEIRVREEREVENSTKKCFLSYFLWVIFY